MSESPLTFPCEFPIKILGAKHDDFVKNVVEVVARHAPDFDRSSVELRPSDKGKYLSVTCTINATSQDQLNSIYSELKSHPDVAMTL